MRSSSLVWMNEWMEWIGWVDGHGMGRLELLGYLDGWLGEWEGFRPLCIIFDSFTCSTTNPAMLSLDINNMHS